MKGIMENLKRADNMLALMNVSGDAVILLAGARQELGEAYKWMKEAQEAYERAEDAQEEREEV